MRPFDQDPNLVARKVDSLIYFVDALLSNVATDFADKPDVAQKYTTIQSAFNNALSTLEHRHHLAAILSADGVQTRLAKWIGQQMTGELEVQPNYEGSMQALVNSAAVLGEDTYMMSIDDMYRAVQKLFCFMDESGKMIQRCNSLAPYARVDSEPLDFLESGLKKTFGGYIIQMVVAEGVMLQLFVTNDQKYGKCDVEVRCDVEGSSLRLPYDGKLADNRFYWTMRHCLKRIGVQKTLDEIKAMCTDNGIYHKRPEAIVAIDKHALSKFVEAQVRELEESGEDKSQVLVRKYKNIEVRYRKIAESRLGTWQMGLSYRGWNLIVNVPNEEQIHRGVPVTPYFASNAASESPIGSQLEDIPAAVWHQFLSLFWQLTRGGDA